MSKSLKGRAYALQMLGMQFLIVSLLSLVVSIWESRVAVTFFMGGMISVLANLWFALVVFRPPLGSPPGRMLVAFYLGEAGKIIIVALLFMLAFQRVPGMKEMTMGLVLLTGFIASQLIAWIYPLIKHRPSAN